MTNGEAEAREALEVLREAIIDASPLWEDVDTAIDAFEAAVRADERTTVAARYEALAEAARLTLDLWEQCLPSISGAESNAWIHGWRYSGPEGGMRPAIGALKSALATLKEVEDA